MSNELLQKIKKIVLILLSILTAAASVCWSVVRAIEGIENVSQESTVNSVIKEDFNMTANQIAYWKNVETERADKAKEALQSQLQRNQIAQNWADLGLHALNEFALSPQGAGSLFRNVAGGVSGFMA